MVVYTFLLGYTSPDEAGLVLVHRSIGVVLDFKHPLACDRSTTCRDCGGCPGNILGQRVEFRLDSDFPFFRIGSVCNVEGGRDEGWFDGG